MTVVRIGVIGAGGRMGAANIQAIANMDGAVLAAAVECAGSSLLGKDASAHAGLEPSGVIFTDDIDAVLAMVDVVVDFTIPHSTLELLEKTTAKNIAHVIGTTGFTPEQEQVLRDASRKGARIVKSGNMSLGVNLLAALVTKAAATLGVEFDIEVLEMHHRHKVDAPSGTALLLGEAAAEGRKISLDENSVRVRDGFTGPREEGSIGFATLRGGSVIGEHEVIFAGPSERITLSHSAQDRSLFANGAIRAAVWIADKESGFYSMADVLGLNA